MKLRRQMRDGSIGGGRSIIIRWVPVVLAILGFIAALPFDGSIGGRWL